MIKIKFLCLPVLFIGLAIVLIVLFPACTSTNPGPPTPAEVIAGQNSGNAVHQKVRIGDREVDGYIIPLGKIHIVCVTTAKGFLGCGAFDVAALDSFGYPAVKMKSSNSNPIATIDDLLNGIVKEANNEASKLGIKTGMTGKEALDKL